MSQTDIYLSVIVPAYNEAARIGKTLERLQQYLAQALFNHEILVVIDGATDATVEVVRQQAERITGLRMIERGVNRGKGFTVKEGMLAAVGQVRLFCDADNSTDIEHFDKMKPLFDQGYDVVIASRNDLDVAGAEQAIAQAWHTS